MPAIAPPRPRPNSSLYCLYMAASLCVIAIYTTEVAKPNIAVGVETNWSIPAWEGVVVGGYVRKSDLCMCDCAPWNTSRIGHLVCKLPVYTSRRGQNSLVVGTEREARYICAREVKKACECKLAGFDVHIGRYFFLAYLSQTAKRLKVYRYCSANCIHSGREYHPNNTYSGNPIGPVL